jgi:zinc/manganese transport system substrate-binding protein
MHKRNLLVWLIGLVVLGLIGLVIYTGTKSVDEKVATGKILIVASLDQYGQVAKAVGGQYVQVTSIIDKASVDPHDFEPTAGVAREYQAAKITISNGGGYDEWSTRLAAANNKATAINVAKLVGYQAGDNEHFWYTPSVPATLAESVAATLIKTDPAHKAAYTKNLTAYKQQLKPLASLRSQVGKLVAGKNVLTTEPVYDNTLTALGAIIEVPEFAHAVEEGEDPSSATIRDWQAAIDSGKIAFVINNSQTTSKLVDQALAYALERRLPIVDIAETMPDGMTYIDWQMNELNALREALE